MFIASPPCHSSIIIICANYIFLKIWDAANDCSYTSSLLFFCGLGYEATPNSVLIMTSPRTLVHGRTVKKRTIIYGTPDFLEVVGACACIGTRSFLLPLEGPGYKATYIYIYSYIKSSPSIKHACIVLNT